MLNELDGKAFEILVRERHRRLIAYSFSLVDNPTIAEDITQDALLTAYKRLADFDSSKNFPVWVRGIIRNKYLEVCRHRKEIPLEVSKLEYLEATHSEWDALKSDFLTDALSVLSECLKKLPEIHKAAVELFYMKELSTAEVAVRLEIADPTLRKRLQRARTNLGDCINEALEHGEDVV